MRTKLILLFILVVMSLQTGCLYIARYDGAYSGKVVDETTREPIEGAAVLGIWYTESPTIAGAHTDYYDARENVTDKNGFFVIPGQGLLLMSRVLPMSVMIFKSGYSYEQEQWDSLKSGLYSKDRIKWEDDKPIFSLKKLTMEERRRWGSPPDPPHNAPFKNVQLMIREIDIDRKERGLDMRGLWNGTKYE